MKNLAKKAITSSRILRLLSRGGEKGAAILMYHSVMEDPQMAVASLGPIVHSSKAFRAQIELLAKESHPVSLDKLARFVQGEVDLPKRSVVVTFDDGYADNYAVALAILREIGVPATFYVTADCVQRQRLPWPSRLRYAFSSTKAASWSDAAGTRWLLGTSQNREQAFDATCAVCCKLAGEAQEKFVTTIEKELDAELPQSNAIRMMSWDQIRDLAGQGHIVGSHTMTHPNIAQLSPETARTELTESKRLLEEQLKRRVAHFSYPCPALSPHWTEGTAEETRRIGYDTAVTTDSGLARRHDNPLRLRRIPPSKSVEGLRWNLECAFAGRKV